MRVSEKRAGSMPAGPIVPSLCWVRSVLKRKLSESGHEPIADLDFLRGDALARLGRYPDAQRAFEDEVRAFPANSQAWARLAVVYGLQHRTIREIDGVARLDGRDVGHQ